MHLSSAPQQTLVGISKASLNWGWFCELVELKGLHVVVTHHHQRGRNAGRTILATPRAVAVPVSWYDSVAPTQRRPAEMKTVAAYAARQGISGIASTVQRSESEGKPVHYTVARKKQAAYERSIHTRQGTEKRVHPSSEGTPFMVVVGIEWYCRAEGIDPSLLQPSEVPVATPPSASSVEGDDDDGRVPSDADASGER